MSRDCVKSQLCASCDAVFDYSCEENEEKQSLLFVEGLLQMIFLYICTLQLNGECSNITEKPFFSSPAKANLNINIQKVPLHSSILLTMLCNFLKWCILMNQIFM